MLRQRLILGLFIVSISVNFGAAVQSLHWLTLPAAALGWYMADLLSGLIHMYMDYRPCPAGKRLNDIFVYEGSRESEEYQSMLRERMASIGPLERISYDFKNHHPRPDALGRRPLWRLIGSTVFIAALPLSLAGNLAAWFMPIPGWLMAGLFAFLVGGGFAQYFHGSLHRAHNPWFIRAMRSIGLLMSPAAHQLHHDTLQRDFATNNGWSNPVINWLFRVLYNRGVLNDAGLTPSG
jgi:Lipid desaturase domain